MTVVSIIIPVFNAELHLERCIESLLAQTLFSCEFLFINDGSTDKSQSIIEEYQKSDSRIILVNQPNQGVSAARNAGLQMAKGDYIGFVDADDTVDRDMFQTLVGIAQQNDADIVVSRYVLHQNEKQILSPDFFNGCRKVESDYIQSQIIPFMIQTEHLNAIWNKLYKRSLIQNHSISFPVGMALGEDGWFNINTFSHAERIYFSDFSGYHYYVNDGSATRDFASKKYYQSLLEEYLRDDSAFANEHLTKEQIVALKSEKFLKKAISLIHEYTNPIHKMGLKASYQSVYKIVNDAVFIEIINKNYTETVVKKGRYEKLIVWAAKNKWIPLLFIATAYSRFRNQ